MRRDRATSRLGFCGCSHFTKTCAMSASDDDISLPATSALVAAASGGRGAKRRRVVDDSDGDSAGAGSPPTVTASRRFDLGDSDSDSDDALEGVSADGMRRGPGGAMTSTDTYGFAHSAGATFSLTMDSIFFAEIHAGRKIITATDVTCKLSVHIRREEGRDDRGYFPCDVFFTLFITTGEEKGIKCETTAAVWVPEDFKDNVLTFFPNYKALNATSQVTNQPRVEITQKEGENDTLTFRHDTFDGSQTFETVVPLVGLEHLERDMEGNLQPWIEDDSLMDVDPDTATYHFLVKDSKSVAETMASVKPEYCSLTIYETKDSQFIIQVFRTVTKDATGHIATATSKRVIIGRNPDAKSNVASTDSVDRMFASAREREAVLAETMAEPSCEKLSVTLSYTTMHGMLSSHNAIDILLWEPTKVKAPDGTIALKQHPVVAMGTMINDGDDIKVMCYQYAMPMDQEVCGKE